MTKKKYEIEIGSNTYTEEAGSLHTALYRAARKAEADGEVKHQPINSMLTIGVVRRA